MTSTKMRSLFQKLKPKPKTHSFNLRYFSSQIPKLQIQHTKLFIDGDFVNSISGKKLDTIDPRTEKSICQVEEGDKQDINIAVSSARKAFDSGPWPRMGGFERSKYMLKLADLIESNNETIVNLITLESGKTLFESTIEVAASIEHLRYYAGWADKIEGKTIPCNTNFGYNFCYSNSEPIGVAGAIIPWNVPFLMAVWKLAPCIATGSTMVIKSAETTPLSALYLSSLIQEAQIPPGVINIVSGYGDTAGHALASNQNIDKLAFTGSVDTGKKIMETASRNLIPVTLELGGKSPSIIFSDCDIDNAAQFHQTSTFLMSGQVCWASSRIFVEESIYDEFVEKTINLTKKRIIGDPFDSNTTQGPQQNKKQFEKVLNYINSGKSEGGNCLLGGGRHGNNGYYVKPTIFGDCSDNMTIVKDEIFGPVMQILKFKNNNFDDLNELLNRANNTSYGLAAGVYTNDVNKINFFTRNLKAGTVWVNCYHVFSSGSPFGGFKNSGIGREQGKEALLNYLQTKTIYQKMNQSTDWY